MATGSFGWDLLYSSVENDIKTDKDVLVCLVHLVLISNGFKCVGLGKSNYIEKYQPGETLPKGWNEIYTLQYLYEGTSYILQATSLETGVMLNLERPDLGTVSLVQLKTRSVLKRTGPLEVMIPGYKDIVDVIKKLLLEKVVGFRKSRDNSTQTVEPMVNPFSDLMKGSALDSLNKDLKMLCKERKNHLKT